MNGFSQQDAFTPSAYASSPSFWTSSPAVQASKNSSPPVVNSVQLVNIRQALPDIFGAIFPYALFNAVQSKCFDPVYKSNDNVVVSAPTGSGKTAILELAICKLALDRGAQNFKIVYQAPTKALCSERARDWEKKFNHMNLKCAELTGDTSPAETRRVGEASIIITTPEKWDSITRKWQDHRRLLQMVELFLIDEVHILKDVRGATLEAVVSRMKTIGANVRFIALSATVPNSDDIATWLGRNHTNPQLPAHRETFGEEFRPVKLQKFVHAFDVKANDFQFDMWLNSRLPGILQRHTRRKPILIFCFTRKSCEMTASSLADLVASQPDHEKLWTIPAQKIPVTSLELQRLVQLGVAFHHAGLDPQDRIAVEQHFLRGQISVICCTSTLAVGVNLPCHTVVLKGTMSFADDRLQECSDLEVMQMLGRAGRPQFDDSAVAIILTRQHNRERYEKMISGREILESTLHLNLIEHLNSEVCLGTVSDMTTAKTWLSGTFLSVRLQRNPAHYQLHNGSNGSSIEDVLEDICQRDITQLKEAGLVSHRDQRLAPSEHGRAMSKYMVEFSTMKLILAIPRGAPMSSLLTILSQASEFKEFRFKPLERPMFRDINPSPFMMFPVKEMICRTDHKISLLVQAELGAVPYPDTLEAAKIRRQLLAEKKIVLERMQRLLRCVVDCKGIGRDGIGMRHALELARAVSARAWEGRPTQLTQIPNIGPVGMRKLSGKGIQTVLELADKEFDEIERLMVRQTPFGTKTKEFLDKFPRLTLHAASNTTQPTKNQPATTTMVATLFYSNQKGAPHWLGKPPALTFMAESSTGDLVYFWRGSIRQLENQAGVELKFTLRPEEAGEWVSCRFSCEEIVGTEVSTVVYHNPLSSTVPAELAGPETMRARLRPRRQVQPQAPAVEDYLGDDDIDDDDLIQAAETVSSRIQAQKGPVPNTLRATAPRARWAGDTHAHGGDEYPTVQDLLAHRIPDPDEIVQSVECDPPSDYEYEPEPIKLPNGRYQCNHPCTGTGRTRAGNPCSHRCCKAGLVKARRKPQQKARKRESTVEGDNIEVRLSSPPSVKRRRVIEGEKQPTPENSPIMTFHGLPAAVPTNMSWQDMVLGLDNNMKNVGFIDLSISDDESEMPNTNKPDAIPVPPPLRQAETHAHPERSSSPIICGEEPSFFELAWPREEASPVQQAEEFVFLPPPATFAPPLPPMLSAPRFPMDDDFLDLALANEWEALEVQEAQRSPFKVGAVDDVLYVGPLEGFGEPREGSFDSEMRARIPARNEADISRIPNPLAHREPATINPALLMKWGIQQEDHPAEEYDADDVNPAWLDDVEEDVVDMFRGFSNFI
ncbi:hypothetical protein B0H63DRAFT_434481 [Podospora didyma]|uniref:DNA 3'-5' helicase n=1 Tax=Podospora didyma TaxID=330526 RepID=A0AAE0NGK4_9PEZI|nr:hypothetical protein B0H63DRAFT_434481 [Podospora didyma]